MLGAAPITMLITFFVSYGVYHLLAKLFGGKASFRQYAAAMAAAYVLVWFSVIPIIGSFLFALSSLWLIAAAVLVTKVTHRISVGKAVLIILIPFVIVIGLGFIAMIAYFSVLNPSTLLPDMCALPVGIFCGDFAATTAGLTLTVTNDMNTSLTINEATARPILDKGGCALSGTPISIGPEQTVRLSFDQDISATEICSLPSGK